MLKRVFISPKKYIQGPGVIQTLGEEIIDIGNKPFLLSDEVVWGIVGKDVEKSFKKEKFSHTYEQFSGEASNSEIDRLTKVAESSKSDVIVGFGGGKTLDTAKAIGDELNLPVVIVPTTASTDAPTSALSVIYSDEGVFEGYKFYNRNPDLVLIDSQIVVRAPAKLFASGIGDAMATLVEAKAAFKRNSTTMAGGKATLAGLAIAEKAEQVLFEQGIAAYKAAKEGLVTPQVENVIEANTLLSGLGFENGGLAVAHAIHNGFTAIGGDIHNLTHGQKVAYGVLVQLLLEGRGEEEILKYIHFFQAIELPTTLKDMHLEETSYQDLIKIGQLATVKEETAQNMDPDLTPEQIADAILAVDLLVKA